VRQKGRRHSCGNSEILLVPSGKTVVHRVLVQRESQPMSNEVETTELSKIANLNGDFRRNYGTLLGAILYLRSISAARRTSQWGGLIVALITAALTWLARQEWPWPGS
jgi:hypothetical protein